MKKNWRVFFKACMTAPRTKCQKACIFFLSEYHYLWTRKTNKRVYTAITLLRVLVRKLLTRSTRFTMSCFCTAPISKFQRKTRQNFAFFSDLNFHFCNHFFKVFTGFDQICHCSVLLNFMKFSRNFANLPR